MYTIICSNITTLSISLAADVTVLDCNDYYYGAPLAGTEPESVTVSQLPWKFIRYSDYVHMDVTVKNKSPSVTTLKVTYSTGAKTIEPEKCSVKYSARASEERLFIAGYLNSSELEIKPNFYKSKILCENSAEPFYLNMLLRKECELGQRVFMEIEPPIYEKINPSVNQSG